MLALDFRPQAFLPRPQLGRQLLAEVLALEHRTDLHLDAAVERRALEPIDRLLDRLHLPEPEAGDDPLGLGKWTVDDRPVIMGSGDELNLEYPTEKLPALPQGWSRDFLLFVDGWAKDADPNTAFSQSVTPLPFHGMSAYPYKPAEHYPDDPDHQRYIRDYLTRPALRLIRPLAPSNPGGITP